jgi:hypothetical protein
MESAVQEPSSKVKQCRRGFSWVGPEPGHNRNVSEPKTLTRVIVIITNVRWKHSTRTGIPMDPPHYLTDAALFTLPITDMANAISDRPGESNEQHFIRAQVATHLILGLAPRDPIEVMLAGHAVMFHALITDSVSNTLRGEIDTMRRASRASIVAMDRGFHLNLDKLKQYQCRPFEAANQAEQNSQPSDARTAPAETMAAPTGNVRHDRMPGAAPSHTAPANKPSPAETPTSMRPSETQLARSPLPFRPAASPPAFCSMNPDPKASLNSAHAGKPTGIDPPAPTIPRASPPAQADAQPGNTLPESPHLNRAQRRQLHHGRPPRHD